MATLQDATASLERMQSFEAAQLVRESDLGSRKNFATAVNPAERLIGLYKRLTVRALEDLPPDKINSVHTRAQADYNLFDQILKFDADKTTSERDQLVAQISNSYNETFNVLFTLIAYSLHRSADFQRLESDARSTLQTVRDGAEGVKGQLVKIRDDASGILDEVRRTAAEQGVSQQAKYFKESATEHENAAESWRRRTVKLAWWLGGFAVLSIFLHRIPFIEPRTTYDAIQIGVSKVLIFAVISYMLYLSARNFLSHKHNQIINTHRQQALLTYRALVDSGAEPKVRDLVLAHAAACIYDPQSTGYAADGKLDAPSAKSVVELIGSPIGSDK